MSKLSKAWSLLQEMYQSCKCRKCQRPHHTLLHIEPKPETQALLSTTKQSEPVNTPVSHHAATGFASNTLLMTCQVLVHSPDGIALKARPLLDSGSSTSFVSDRLAQNLRLPKTSQDIKISGIAGISHHSPLHSVVNFDISPLHTKSDKINVSAVIIPRVTSDLPQQPVHHKSTWSHLHKLNLADPDFGRPGRIDILLGVDVYANIMLQGRRTGPPDAPVAFEIKFGWVLTGKTGPTSFSNHCVTVNHVSTISGDELLSKFWEVEETPKNHSMDSYSQEECLVVSHFKENHHKSKDGRFVVPLTLSWSQLIICRKPLIKFSICQCTLYTRKPPPQQRFELYLMHATKKKRKKGRHGLIFERLRY